VLKKRKLNEEWFKNKRKLEVAKEKGAQNQKLIFRRAEKYIKVYRDQITY
jgi:large subunit ribosomal protein L7e